MTPQQAAHPWFDPQRFAPRQFAAAVRRHHAPLGQAHLADLTWRVRLTEAWSSWLRRANGDPVAADDLLICGTDREALDLALGGLLAQGDVVLVAEPAAETALLTILRSGGRYVDVGRRDDGAVDPASLAAAAAWHPQAVVYAEAPSLLADDAVTAGPDGLRATVVDMRQALWPQQLPDATAVILALHDPDAPAEPLLHAVVVPPGWGRDLAALAGDARLGTAQIEHADAVLQGLLADPAWAPRAGAVLAAVAADFLRAVADWPGARVVGHLGLRAAVECMAGDQAALAASLPQWAAALRAYGSHPGRNLLVAELAVQALLRGDTRP